MHNVEFEKIVNMKTLFIGDKLGIKILKFTSFMPDLLGGKYENVGATVSHMTPSLSRLCLSLSIHKYINPYVRKYIY